MRSLPSACRLNAWPGPAPPINVARNSPAISSNVESTSLELQRFRVISKSDRGKLRAKFVWSLSGRRPRVAWLGPCLEARPCSPTLRPLRLGVFRADDGGFAALEASLRRVAGVSRLYWCNSPRLVAVRSRFGVVWRPRARRGTQVASTPRRTTPLTPSVDSRPCVRPHIGHVGHSRPSMKQPPSTSIFPHQQAKKSPQNQYVLSFIPVNNAVGPRRLSLRGPTVTYRLSARLRAP